jgi:glycine cleavage system H lipoate-binding protein
VRGEAVVKPEELLYARTQITEVNAALPDNLDKLSQDPLGAGWIVKGIVQDEAELARLLDYQAYQAQCAEEGS